MNEATPAPDTPTDPPPGDTTIVEAGPQASAAPQGHGLAYTVIAVFLFAMAFGIWGLWAVFAPQPDNPVAQLETQRGRIAALEQQVANLSRSDQVSREANTKLQGTLAERDEEISGLRADVNFYERFVGATAQRRGLSVHELRLEPQPATENTAQTARPWHFTATLTQNLSRGAISQGDLTVSLEGSRDGRLQQLDWNSLRQQPDAPAVDYSFKYFQQVEGDILVPQGLQPVRLVVRLVPRGGKAVEHSITWAEATGAKTGAETQPGR